MCVIILDDWVWVFGGLRELLVRYSMLLTEDDLKVLYRLYDGEGREILANIVLEYRNDRIYSSLIMFRELEINDLTRVLKEAKDDFISIILTREKGGNAELSKLLENNIIST